MNYQLNNHDKAETKSLWEVAKKFWPLVAHEKTAMAITLVAILVNSLLNLWAPIIIGHTVDRYFLARDYNGVLENSAILLAIFAGAFVASYIQTRVMGGVSQRVLFSLRNLIFTKLQALPVAFFNQNKAGDLISRINNDTDKLNQFFSRGLMQFVGSLFMVVGTGIAVISINPRLGLAALLPALGILIITRLLSGWIKRKNAANLQTTGSLSANISENLANFSVIVAFNRRDYFRERFSEANDANFATSVKAGIANNMFAPVYSFASNIAILIVIAYGAHLVSIQALTIGVLISFITYVTRFYDPLRQIAALWSTFQLALAAWDRVLDILSLEADMPTVEHFITGNATSVLEFQNVKFAYPNGKTVLHDVNFTLEAGKTYALVGPTGGGKTTAASLMARLYDPTEGTVLLHGRDIKSYGADERTKKIGFILQEPFLFTGTVRDNIIYGNDEYTGFTSEQLATVLAEAGLDTLLARFDKGLETEISGSGVSLSLGQRQLIAFIRAALRKPDLLILDEATANIDTVTEQLLEDIIKRLPATTTRVIIAHRLNTIENADEIFFVNGGEIVRAGSLDKAVELLMHGGRAS